MWTCGIVIVSTILVTARGDGDARRIPGDILLGSGISAYQYEGAWNEDGRTPSLWDNALHTNNVTPDKSNADVADDGYHRYKEDVQLIRKMGLDTFRISFSWSRILPDLYINNINQAGIDYYNNFIDELIKYNITPIVTIFQEDAPAKMGDFGGWTNAAVIDFYLDFANLVFSTFGDRVKMWVTVNEPIVYCYYNYGRLKTLPSVYLPGVGDYMCLKNLLIAHARAYRLYDERYRKQQNGRVGFVVYNHWHEPLTNSTDDIEAADDAHEFQTGFFFNPIFTKDGDFPELVRRRIAAKSAEQGFARSRLPTLSADEIELVKGTADFVGLNFYTTVSVYRNKSVDILNPGPSLKNDVYMTIPEDPTKSKATDLIKPKPLGLYKLLMKIKDQYNNPPVLITENGCTVTSPDLDDFYRIEFLNAYINTLLDAKENGSNVQGYSAWSFMDVFEYRHGYIRKFGLYQVDYTSPNRTRTARRAAHYFTNVTTTRTIYKKLSKHDYLL